MKEFRDFRSNLETFIKDLKELIEKNQKRVEELLSKKQKSFENFIKPLEEMEEELELFFTPLSHLNSVNNSKETQDIYTQALPIITEYSTKLSQNEDLYNAYKEIYQKEKERLNQEQKRVLELNIQSFELSGAHLDKATKERLAKINLRKSELSNEFSQNLLDATNAYERIIEDEADVEGIPPSDLATAEFEEDGVKKWRFTLQMPSYIAYMTYGPNRQIREEIYRAYVTRAPQNSAIIDEFLALREEMSKLLGFENFAQYSLATKMAKDEKSVVGFLEELLDRSYDQCTKEVADLKKFAGFDIEAWDSAFYSEKMKKEHYDIDEEAYRPYFEQQSVVSGLFEFLNKMFDLEFVPNDAKLWHEKAKSYDIYEAGELRARLYLDLEARESKRGGAWMHDWQTHMRRSDGSVQLASAFVVCNFPPSSEDAPSLLRHDDVVTLFHEMGHAIHHLLSRVEENEVSGVNGVEWDAVEFPSQFLENFAYEKSVLQMFAKHYQTGEVLPEAMIDRLIKAKNFLSAMAMQRQLEFSLFDFLLHQKLYQKEEVQALLDSIRKRTALIKPPSYNRFQNGFAHIFAGGYAAGYYSYKWAEVLSADAFEAVVSEGIFASQKAKAYKEIILSKGGSESMSRLYEEFMGREAKTEPLLRLNGIA
ncbi:Oligopeptidase A [hydrothermal vent metagenome]|uniref:oligopeptidase A n=1 Tax=hydrothermal vent metagenome TaxID=652676 RepID=A0A1W1BRY4_9ZZZZ